MTDYLYHPGDKVRVRPDLEVQTDYKMLSGESKNRAWWIYPWMADYAGEVITIMEISPHGVYKADVGGCVWTDEMFEPALASECVCNSLL